MMQSLDILRLALSSAHHFWTLKPPNNGHVGDECYVHYSEVVLSEF